MEYEELSAQLIVDDPETSVLRVESTISGLQFNSRGGIKRVRVEAGLKRFCNAPSYAFPWHQGGIPVPFAPE